jgi:putative heme-binding domain-containing protein
MQPTAVFALVALVGGIVAQDPAGQAPAVERIFDGRSLEGWDGDPRVWSVRDGMIVGSTVEQRASRNTFLIWKGGELRDFELTFAVRVEGDNNSGVQYRSKRLEGYGVAGYQCDVHPQAELCGHLYDEGGRGSLALAGQRVETDPVTGGGKVTGKLAAPATVDLGKWHSYRIVARGTKLQHEIDGALVADVDDRWQHAALHGILALQVHAGERMTVWFKDLELRRLPTQEIAVVTPSEQPKWLWLPAGTKGEEGFFRREFELGEAPAEAQLAATGDNHLRVQLNGERVMKSDTWESPQTCYVQKHLRPGKNVLAVYVANDTGPAGFVLRLDWRNADKTAASVLSDGSWRCATDDQKGWETAGFAATAWQPPQVIGDLGQAGLTWSSVLGADALAPAAFSAEPQPVVPAPELHTLPGFVAERVFAVPRMLGSWVSLTVDDRGRFYTSDQDHGLYRLTVAANTTTVERVQVDLGGCQGLLWAHGALYAVVNGGRSGLYRLRDTDGDDMLDKVELLRELKGNGEHGPHAIVLDPDGQHLVVLCGNHTALTPLDQSRAPRNWAEDQVLPRYDDPNGHAVGVMAPGGYIVRTDPDGVQWELLCAGFRNTYDIAFDRSGELFGFDADMEWDMGLPWYRPTRICHAVSAGEFGWRNGSGKWPADYPDSLPPVLDIGPGSPTGLVFGYGSSFPPEYESALYACDWTFGTIYAVHLTPRGASFGGTKEEFVSGAPMAVTDAVVGQDGAFYFTVGGRGSASSLYRVRAVTPAAHRDVAATISPAQQARRALETFHGHADGVAIAAAWPALGSDDPFLRHAARIAVEAQPSEQWRQRALEPAGNPWAALTALLALSHQGNKDDLPAIVAALARLDFAHLDRLQRVAFVRVHELADIRLGPIADDLRLQLGQRLLALFPCGDERVDRELCALLCRLDAPGVVDKAMPLLDSRPAPAPPWLDVTGRNANYGGAIEKMIADMPPASGIAVANGLRTVRHGFTLAQRQALLQFLGAAMKKPGGASFRGYLSHMFDDVVAQLTDAEKAELAVVIGKKPPPAEPYRATPPKGPGRTWTLDEAAALARNGLQQRSFASGRNLFHASSCAACHYFAGEGGSVGPDLTSLGNKYSARDVLESILEPSKVVSDQYAGAVLKKKDGTSLFGRVVAVGSGATAGYDVLPAVADPKMVHVAAAEVAAVEPSKLSPMPTNLVDRLNQDELLDLLAFLLSRGDERAAMFKAEPEKKAPGKPPAK